MTDVDRAVARAGEVLSRTRGNSRLAKRSRQRQARRLKTRVGRIVLAATAIVLGVISWGLLVAPVGLGGLFLTVLLMMVAAVVFWNWPGFPDAGDGPALPTTALAQLPIQTEEWLARQRPALPAPAVQLVDGIGLKLETLSAQLQTLDEREPAAAQVRKLIGDDLPELVKGWQRVPEPLRREERHGMTPDRQLVEGLEVVDAELKRMSEQLAAGDLDKLAVQEKFLQLKYRGDPELGG